MRYDDKHNLWRCDTTPGGALVAIDSVRVGFSASKWRGRCTLGVTARGVAPDVAPARMRRIKRKNGEREWLEVESVRTHGNGKKRGEVHRFTEGSTEWEVEWQTRNDVPAGSVEYDMTSPPGLQFYPQPALTQAEIDEGCSRPDNVVGSYAVYYPVSGRILNALGEEVENYETGKFSHIYAAYLIDANDAQTKCTMTVEDGVLSVALPSAWLDAATFPVRLDPDFGYTSIGATTTNSNANVFNVRGPYSPASNGTITSLSIYCGATGAVSCTVGLYGWSSSWPSSKVVDTAGGTLTANAWNQQATDSSPAIASATEYGICWNQDGTWTMCYDAGSIGRGTVTSTTYSAGALSDPAPAGTLTASDRTFSVYGTYTASATTSIIPILHNIWRS